MSSTPLRYPGGKAKLFKHTSFLINDNFSNKPNYVEPFAGGSGLALKLLFSEKVNCIFINDFDYNIYAFWYSILNYTEEFIQKIDNIVFSIEFWNQQKKIYLEPSNYNIFEVGFSTFYLNRTNRSGILLAGPIGGKNQDGNYKMNCRFNKDKLISIIYKISLYKDRIYISNEDGCSFLEHIDKELTNSLFYIDPPYVKKGPMLYKNAFNIDDHVKLKNAIINLKNLWFTTYDIDDLIVKLYENFTIQKFELNYNIGIRKRSFEYIIYSKSIIHPNEVKF